MCTMNEIEKITFELECTVCDDCYIVVVQFCNVQNRVLSQASFIFYKVFNKMMVDHITKKKSENDYNSFERYLYDVIKGNKSNVIDVWPLNGAVRRKQTLKNTLKGQSMYLKDLKKIFPGDYQDCVKMIILDMKDINGNYSDKESIKEYEELIGTFFLNDNKPNKKAQQQCIIYEIINKQLNVDYIIREGSLKCDLLDLNNMYFSEKEILFFKNKDKYGPMYLCQLCELIMNGFKSGFKITSGRRQVKNTLEAKNYLIYIPMLASQLNINLKKKQGKKKKNNQNQKPAEITVINTEEAIVCTKFDINLVTFYPQCYQLVYDTKSSYYQCISKFVKYKSGINWMVNHRVIDKDNNGNQTQNITCISIKTLSQSNINYNISNTIYTNGKTVVGRDYLLVVLMLFLIVLWLLFKFYSLSHNNAPIKAFE